MFVKIVVACFSSDLELASGGSGYSQQWQAAAGTVSGGSPAGTVSGYSQQQAQLQQQSSRSRYSHRRQQQ